MKVSVIVPVFKVEAHIEACLQSIIDQTYQDIELIVVDDKSPDNSISLARELLVKSKYANFTILENAFNSGVSVSRNNGLAIANGEYVLFVDSDDTIVSTMLAEMVAIATEHDVDIVVCDTFRIGTDTSQKPEVWKASLTGLVDGATAIDAMLRFKETSYIWNNLYRRSLFKDIKFVDNIYYEDMLIKPLLWKKSRQLYFYPKPLYNYFERSGSITTRLGDLNKYLGIPDCCQAIEDAFAQDTQASPAMRVNMVLFLYTWIRNLTLTIISANMPYEAVKPLLEKYSSYLKVSNILKISNGADKRLPLFLLILKASPYLYWKRFSTQLLAK
ncbi:glycosyltransferase family 2 protein [Hymenobacter bucti]|uniref:Glycosyltransferase family 2 protein n=1 Tax=Hymenobacter bucti TaxID=1844114 RepID=A0ABW4QX94_9BACT